MSVVLCLHSDVLDQANKACLDYSCLTGVGSSVHAKLLMLEAHCLPGMAVCGREVEMDAIKKTLEKMLIVWLKRQVGQARVCVCICVCLSVCARVWVCVY